MKSLAMVAALLALPACGADPGTNSASPPSSTNRPDPTLHEQNNRSDSGRGDAARDPGGRSPHEKGKR